MIQEEAEARTVESPNPGNTRRRLAYPAIAIILSCLVPGCVVLLLVLDLGWGLFAPAYTNDWYVEFSFRPYLTPIAALLLGSAIVFAAGYSALWFRKPKWNISFVRIFSVYAIFFGVGFTIWILIFSFVIPTGYWFADGVSGPSSGHIHDSALQLLISLPILLAGVYGLFVSTWVAGHPTLAHPPDRRDQPNHLTRSGWIRSGCAFAACVVVLGILLSPAVSPLSYVHDADRDGKADKVDLFPGDPNFWAPVHIMYDINESAEAFVITFLGTTYEVDPLPIADFYLSTSDTADEILLDREPLSEMKSGEAFSGVTFFDNTNTGFLDSGDVLHFDKTVYALFDKYALSDASGGNTYISGSLQAF